MVLNPTNKAREKEPNLLIIDATITRDSNKSLLWTLKAVTSKNDDCSIARKRRSSIAFWQVQGSKCAWAWKPVDTHAGLSDCWRS